MNGSYSNVVLLHSEEMLWVKTKQYYCGCSSKLGSKHYNSETGQQPDAGLRKKNVKQWWVLEKRAAHKSHSQMIYLEKILARLQIENRISMQNAERKKALCSISSKGV